MQPKGARSCVMLSLHTGRVMKPKLADDGTSNSSSISSNSKESLRLTGMIEIDVFGSRMSVALHKEAFLQTLYTVLKIIA